jgi:capping protein beta
VPPASIYVSVSPRKLSFLKPSESESSCELLSLRHICTPMASDSTQILRSGLNLMRRLPPSDVRRNVSGLCVLGAGLTEEWLQRIDTPLAVGFDSVAGKSFLLCDYNRDGDSYRSPWSNTYYPALADGFLPSTALRTLEERAGEVWEAYREAYYSSRGDESAGISSVYCWSLGDGTGESPADPFASCWLIKKGRVAS